MIWRDSRGTLPQADGGRLTTGDIMNSDPGRDGVRLACVGSAERLLQRNGPRIRTSLTRSLASSDISCAIRS